MVSSNNTSGASRFFHGSPFSGSGRASWFLLLALVLSLAAIAADQFSAPILYTTSPLWAAIAFILLVWRRKEKPLSPGETPDSFQLSKGRAAAFLTAHFVLMVAAHWLTPALQPLAGKTTLGGFLLAGVKLCVLLPTLFLLPLSQWKKVLKLYASEGVAALVVLITFFPRRALDSIWPWYGQVLGHTVFSLSRLMVPGLGYVKDLTPTLMGPDLDVTIVQGCSGINGFELFDFLFSLVVILDWNILRKNRTLIAYFAGLLAMFLGNALRITAFVVLGNHGLAESITRFHVSAGWIFFSGIFLVYLCLIYGWMLQKRNSVVESPREA
jgi:exosortase/archaeosortase family protein